MPGHEYQFWVYILSNRSHTLYIGVTNGLRKRVSQHRKQTPGSFTARYKITRLVYFESYQYINNAIAREKELKHWTRAQKIALIESITQPGKNLCRTNQHRHKLPQAQIPPYRFSLCCCCFCFSCLSSPKGICVSPVQPLVEG